MAFGSLNVATVHQKKLSSHCISPSVCPPCMKNVESAQYLWFECSFSFNLWWKLFSIFNVCWVFSICPKENVLQLLWGLKLLAKSKILWSNVVKVTLSEIWFERNQRIFKEQSSNWSDISDSISESVSLVLNEFFLQDICLNLHAFISSPMY